MHPRAEECARRRAERIATANRNHLHEMALTHKHNLRYVHVRNQMCEVDRDYRPVRGQHFHLAPKGGITVAYAKPERKGSRIIRVSCAICHDSDSYCKRMGRYNAACNYEVGEFIEVRVPKNTTIPVFLSRMFGEML